MSSGFSDSFNDSFEFFDNPVLNNAMPNIEKRSNSTLSQVDQSYFDSGDEFFYALNNFEPVNENPKNPHDETICSSFAEKALFSKNASPAALSCNSLKLRDEHMSLFKNEDIVMKDVSPGPKTSKNETFKENCSPDFYGLPIQVKTLMKNFKGIDDLYGWQKKCLNLEAVKRRKNLVYTLPTGGGKTLVAELLMLREILCNKKNAIFILPFVAIVQEKIQSLAPFALELGFLVEEYAAGRGQYPPKKRRRKNSIYICTIEKALGLVNSLIEESRLNEIGLVVVDELHLLGESSGRGATLEGLLTKIMYVNEAAHIVGMSATIGNLEEVADFLQAELFKENYRPIEIKEYVKCENEMFAVKLNEEDILVDKKMINYHYSANTAKLDPDRIGGLVMDIAPNDSCLIFCSSRKNCENVAVLLTRVLPRSLEEHKKDEKQRLINFLKAEGELCPILEKTLKFGVAYHHSGLTSEERKLLEDAFKSGVLCVICCTSTLAAGVNLPARRVILRTPYIGNQLLTKGRYKQMIGRAGRAGMGSELGESILITIPKDLEKVKTLLSSGMDESLSSLHTEASRGINNLILSSILLSITLTRSDVHKLVSRTLLSIQEKKLDISVKSIVDNAISTLFRTGIIKIKRTEKPGPEREIVVVYPSQQNVEEAMELQSQKKIKCTVNVPYDAEFELCELGRAAMKGCIDLPTAFTLYEDLKTAQKNLNLINHLHLLYLVTPYDYLNQIKPVGSVYYDVVMELSPEEMDVVKLIGINEPVIIKIREGIIPKNVEARVVHRLYVTLILFELWRQESIYRVAEKYQINRGIVQNLMSSTASFASSVVRFCQEFEEFWAFKELLSTFGEKIMYCCAVELEPLMELPSVKIGRARQLYKAGYKTLQSIAKTTAKEMQSKIEHLPTNVVKQIIATANLLIVEKVENLRDEAEEFLDGIDLKNYI